MSSGRLILPLLASIREAHAREDQTQPGDPLRGLTLPRQGCQEDAVYLREAFRARRPVSQVDTALASVLRATGEILAVSGRPPGPGRDLDFVHAWVALLQVGVNALSTPEAACLLAQVHPPSEPFLPNPDEARGDPGREPDVETLREPAPVVELPPIPTAPQRVLVLASNAPHNPWPGKSLSLVTVRVQDVATGEITDVQILAHPQMGPDPDRTW